MLDNYGDPDPSKRFIKCDFNDWDSINRLAKQYKHKFNGIIFDYSVFKYVNEGGIRTWLVMRLINIIVKQKWQTS
jgi:hypothetical protein